MATWLSQCLTLHLITPFPSDSSATSVFRKVDGVARNPGRFSPSPPAIRKARRKIDNSGQNYDYGCDTPSSTAKGSSCLLQIAVGINDRDNSMLQYRKTGRRRADLIYCTLTGHAYRYQGTKGWARMSEQSGGGGAGDGCIPPAATTLNIACPCEKGSGWKDGEGRGDDFTDLAARTHPADPRRVVK